MTIIITATAAEIRKKAKNYNFSPSQNLSDAQIKANILSDSEAPPHDDALLDLYYARKLAHNNIAA